MKIAFIGQKGIPAISGGVEKHVEKLATRLAQSGHEVTVYVRPHYTNPRLTKFQGVRLVHLPSIRTKHLDAITHAFMATVHALFQPYDVIHYQMIGSSVLSIIPRLLKPGTRVVATFHSRDYFHKKWNAFARLCLRMAEYLTCRFPEKTIAISETLFEHAKAKYGKELVLIPNGAETGFEPDTEPLNQWGLRPKRYVLSVSRLVEHKGIHYLIKAFQDLERMNKVPNNFKLVIVGTHAETPEYEKYLKVVSAGSANILLVGEQTGKTLAALFSHALLFVQPSEDEGLSLALLEAMGYGVAPIVSDIPANVEAIKSDCGSIFRNKDVESLKSELAYFINRPEEAEAMGKLAKARIEEHYSWDAIARRTEEVYDDLIKQHSIKKGNYAHLRSK